MGGLLREAITDDEAEALEELVAIISARFDFPMLKRQWREHFEAIMADRGCPPASALVRH